MQVFRDENTLLFCPLEEVPSNLNVRVILKDDEPQVVTEDINPDRINVEVKNGVIVKVDGKY
jgi:hypothetical protein